MAKETPTATMPQSDLYVARLTRVTLVWVLTALVLFPVLAILGLLMRTQQGGYLQAMPPEYFYAIMTLHGLGMVGLWFVAGVAGLSVLLARYVKPTLAVSWIAHGATLAGVVLLVGATLVGRLGVGWYFLYPLPFFSGGTWPGWATAALFVALAIMGVGWTLWTGDLLWAIARRYRLSHALGWHYLRGDATPEVPPIIIISTVSFIGVLAGLVAAVVILVLVGVERLGGSFTNDALLIKNLTFYFGHMLVNITMYFGVAMVYEVLPAYAGRPWKTNTLVVVAWNLVLLLVMFAYLHHLYMDFAQPQWLQVTGQLSSYLISVPAAVVTIFSTLVLLYGATMRWRLASLMLFLGVMGWAIGGVAAVIDSTVAVNTHFHNTLWVPAHFHTYYIMGVVLMILGTVFHLVTDLSKLPESGTLTRAIVGTVGVGGYGFVLMLYLAGVAGVPRRYSVYPEEVAVGTLYAKVSLAFIAVLLVGALIYIWETWRRCLKALSA
ncbi:MAG TPA: cbb3-type cytochrome c oxidase subunit I [Vicinamibacterales bacterium]|nr:cbb3-type cytochrome c oxidase subunit I [Vicinamibacterales bacterium]